MSQSTLGDDELFGEAANEMREDVETSLGAAREALPAAEDVWEVDADNTLGALNALRSGLDAGEAEEHLHDAKKWYTMGERAEAFDDAADLADEIESIEALLGDLGDAREQVGDLTATIPQVKGALEDLDDSSAATATGSSGEGDDTAADDAESEPEAKA